MKGQAQNNVAFIYSVNMLKNLLSMELITDEEYEKIVNISRTHYGIENICI